LLKGDLPWSRIPYTDKIAKNEATRKMKEETTERELCHDLPKEFSKFIIYAKNLEYEEKPNY
jgi:casein kinase 1